MISRALYGGIADISFSNEGRVASGSALEAALLYDPQAGGQAAGRGALQAAIEHHGARGKVVA